MKKILMSIKPKWCELIADGKKPIEVRKSAPKEIPFKCYIYQTKSRDNSIYKRFKVDDMRCRKVIGEFICDKIYGIYYSIYPHEPLVYEEIGVLNRVDLGKDTCLTEYEINEYLNGKNGYAWHISNLKIYDKPKELSEFGIIRPPQSWQYVEVEEW